MVFASNKDGTIFVIGREAADRYNKLESAQTLLGSKTWIGPTNQHTIVDNVAELSR